ncbi:MAG: hypothetical protein P8125_09520 [Gemmatimonadota bacterium]|jgi:hypothetical protein
MPRLRFLIPVLAIAAVMVLASMSISVNSTADADTRRIKAALASAPESEAMQDTTFKCPQNRDSLDSVTPIDSIHVTVRPGRWLRRIRVPSVPGSTADSVFSDTSKQVPHMAPHLLPDFTGMRVELRVSGGVGAHPGTYQFEATASLPRCQNDEGFLRRIHVDGPEKGRGSNGPPEITVVGIYDRMLSAPAILDQAASCVKCGRVQVCGTDPGC